MHRQVLFANWDNEPHTNDKRVYELYGTLRWSPALCSGSISRTMFCVHHYVCANHTSPRVCVRVRIEQREDRLARR